jgi:hypothetical protein
MAYMGHLYFNEMTMEKFNKYTSLFDDLITQHNLNEKNTFVAMVGSQDTTNVITAKIRNEDGQDIEIYGAEAFKNYFEDKKIPVTAIVGGPSNIERSVEFTPKSLCIVETIFTNTRRNLTYKEIIIDVNNLQENMSCLSFQRYIQGVLKEEITPQDINELPTDRHNNNFVEILYKNLNDNLWDRFVNNGMMMHNQQYIVRSTVNMLTQFFETNSNESDISKYIFNCAIQKPDMFKLIKSELPWEVVKDLEYKHINLFRFSAIQQALTRKVITAEQIISHETLISWLDNANKHVTLKDFLNFMEQKEISPQNSSLNFPSLNLDIDGSQKINETEDYSPIGSPVDEKFGCRIA